MGNDQLAWHRPKCEERQHCCQVSPHSNVDGKEDEDDVENDDDVVDEDDYENEDVEEDVLDDHEQDLCVSIPLSRVVKIFLFTFTFHSRFKLSDCKV